MSQTEKIEMTWIGGESTDIEARKMPVQTINTLRSLSDNYPTMTQSRILGLIIEFWVETGSTVDMIENEVDGQLMEEHGVFVPALLDSREYWEKEKYTREEMWDKLFEQKSVRYHPEFDDIKFDRHKLSIPKVYKDAFDDLVEESENWHRLNKTLLLANMVHYFTTSVFADRFERLKTKRQILQILNGDLVDSEEQTNAFTKIVLENYHPDVSNKVVDAIDKAQLRSEEEQRFFLETEEYGEIDTRDLSDDHDKQISFYNIMDWVHKDNGGKNPLPKSAKYRIPLFRSGINYISQKYCDTFDENDMRDLESYEDTGTLSKEWIVSKFEHINPDYKASEKTVENEVLPRLNEVNYKGDVLYFAPDKTPPRLDYGEAKMENAIAEEIIRLSKRYGNSRSIIAGIEEQGFDRKPFHTTIENQETDVYSLVTNMNVDQLKSVAHYMANGLPSHMKEEWDLNEEIVKYLPY